VLPALVYPHPILDEPWDGRRLQDTIFQGDDRVVVDTRGHHAQTNDARWLQHCLVNKIDCHGLHLLDFLGGNLVV